MKQEPKRYIVKTLGCKANVYDSQLIESELLRRGWVAAVDDVSADLCIVNSCTVTDEADKQSRKLAARLAKRNPRARVVVTGCLAEVEAERLTRYEGIHYVVKNRDKYHLVDLILATISPDTAAGSKEKEATDWPDSAHAIPLFQPDNGTFEQTSRTRAFLKIQEGCDNFCSYCIIPYGRGPCRSLSISDVVKRINHLVRQGVREVVLTGTNLGRFGVDWSGESQTLALIQSILADTGIERLRVGSLNPAEIVPEMTALIEKEPRFCPHFHISLQSPHSEILQAMKRRYSWQVVKECLERIAGIAVNSVGGAFVGMDVITGFPGETEEQFKWTCDALASVPWQRLHVFPFSERSGTPAARMIDVVSRSERVRRARILRELSMNRLVGKYDEILKTCDSRNENLTGVLLEGRVLGPDGTKNWYSGYTENYVHVLVESSDSKVQSNQIVSAKPDRLWVDKIGGNVSVLASV